MKSRQPHGGHTVGIWYEFFVLWEGNNGFYGEYLSISCYRDAVRFEFSQEVDKLLCSIEYFLRVLTDVCLINENKEYQLGIDV